MRRPTGGAPVIGYHRPGRPRDGAGEWRFYRRCWLLVAAIHVAVMLLPFAFIGDSWAMVWFLGNLPLSAWAEERWGLGSESAVLIIAITAANSVAVATISAAIAAAVRHVLPKGRP